MIDSFSRPRVSRNVRRIRGRLQEIENLLLLGNHEMGSYFAESLMGPSFGASESGARQGSMPEFVLGSGVARRPAAFNAHSGYASNPRLHPTARYRRAMLVLAAAGEPQRWAE